jgi:uncharacterized protein YbaP (TraB family)
MTTASNLTTMISHLSRPLPSLAPHRRLMTRALWLILLLVFPLTGHSAACRPVGAEKSAAAKGQDFNRGLLWKIEAPGVAPSYLFGTYHTSDPRITILPCPVHEVFNRTSSYTMEVIFNGAGIVSMAEAMFFSDGNTLKDVLGEPLYEETLRAVGVSETGGSSSINRMKPWAVMMTLIDPRESGGLFLDLALQLAATRFGKPTYGLETMQEQIAVFDDMSLDDQVVLLRDTVQNHQLTQGAMEELTQAYLKRDLGALLVISEKYKPQDARVHDAMMERLLLRRNINMAERMRVRLKEGNAFVAVGALHLPGDNGLLSLLSRAGYRVSPVY